MTSRGRIPNELPPMFTVRDGLAHGPFHGIRMPRSQVAVLESRCHALAAVLRPEDALAGPTAARLWGMPLPRRLEDSPLLHVSTLLPARAPRRAGVVATGRRSSGTTMLRGLPVLEVWETCRSLASMMSAVGLTCVIDFIVTGNLHRSALSELAALESYLAAHEHHPGIVRLRRAFAQARVGSWSPRETQLRLLVTGAGIPEPQLNVRLPLPGGRELVPDLAWPLYRVAAEYNGTHHNKPGQRIHDLRRIDDYTDIGWTTVNIEKTELLQHPDSVVFRVAQRLASRGWRPPRGLAQLTDGPLS